MQKTIAVPPFHLNKVSTFNPYRVIGSRIHKCRTLASISISTLAERLGVSSSLLVAIEEGLVKIPSTFLAQIAQETRTSLIFLLTGIGEKQILSASEKMGDFSSFVGFISHLSDDKKSLLYQILTFLIPS